MTASSVPIANSQSVKLFINYMMDHYARSRSIANS
jgi:hypothetical protein